jgi:hypothetical protein
MIRQKLRLFSMLACLIAGYSGTAWAADTITGVVRNGTRSQFAAGDEVILLHPKAGKENPAHLNQSMHEEARTTTDAQGSFSLTVRNSGSAYLVRVVHQGVSYDQPASAGDALSIDVFDAAASVPGISGTIEIIRLGSVANQLHVSDMIELRNDSSPPLTKSGDRAFEVYLPAYAKLDSILAAHSAAGPRASSGANSGEGADGRSKGGSDGATGRGAEQTATLLSAAPIPDAPGHYSVNFPLRPGATKFAFNYDLPYDGHATFRPKNIYPLQQLAVMTPPSMKFTSQTSAFIVLPAGDDRYQVEAASMVKAGAAPQFEISGLRSVPALPAPAQSTAKPTVAAQAIPVVSALASAQSRSQGANDSKDLNQAGNFTSAPGSFQKQSREEWWVVYGSAVILGTCGILLWRRQGVTSTRTRVPQKINNRVETRPPLTDVFKDELRQLEIDRSCGAITGNEYVSAKQALEETVRRALARAGTG